MRVGHDHIGVSTPFYCTDGNGRFLLHRRSSKCRDEQGAWDTGSGELEFGAALADNVLREVREEVGLSVTLHDFGADFEGTEPDFKRLIPPRYLNRHRVDAAHEHVAFVYVAASPTDAVKPTYADDRSDEWRWFSRDELDDPSYAIRDNIKFYAKAALDSLTRKGAAR